MTRYESLKELCLDLGFSLDILSDLNEISDNEYEITFRDVKLNTLVNSVLDNNYYSKRVRNHTSESLILIEKLYIDEKWQYISFSFENSDFGVNCIISTLSVQYFSQTGGNVNINSPQIADSLRREELVDVVG